MGNLVHIEPDGPSVAGNTTNADLESLVDDYAASLAFIRQQTEVLERTEYQIIAALDAQGATVMDHPRYHVEVSRKTEWAKDKLYMLAEFVPPDALAKAFTPAHEETITVAEKWDVRKVLPLAKYGECAKAIIESARIEGAPKLHVEAK